LVDDSQKQVKVTGWLRTAVDTGLLSFLLVTWFFISYIGPEVNWPDATLRLSAFYYYGTPLLHGLPLGDMLAVLAVTIAALALASVRFVGKDIGREAHARCCLHQLSIEELARQKEPPPFLDWNRGGSYHPGTIGLL